MIVLGGSTLGKCLNNESGALMDGISVFVKEDPEISAPSPGEDTSEQAPDTKQEVILLVY